MQYIHRLSEIIIATDCVSGKRYLGQALQHTKARKQLPPYFLTFDIIRQGERHDHDSRQRDRIRVSRTRIKLTERCIRNYLPNEINSVPDHILARIHTHSIQGFSSCLKTYELNQYEVICNRANCYVCQQHLKN